MKMEIDFQIRLPGVPIFYVRASLEITVADFSEILYREYRVPSHRFSYHGRILEDDDTLYSYILETSAPIDAANVRGMTSSPPVTGTVSGTISLFPGSSTSTGLPELLQGGIRIIPGPVQGGIRIIPGPVSTLYTMPGFGLVLPFAYAGVSILFPWPRSSRELHEFPTRPSASALLPGSHSSRGLFSLLRGGQQLLPGTSSNLPGTSALFPEPHVRRLLWPFFNLPTGTGASTLLSGTRESRRLHELSEGATRLRLHPGPSSTLSTRGPGVPMYPVQLLQLRAMGFYNFQRNMQALQTTAGNVKEAVELLLL